MTHPSKAIDNLYITVGTAEIDDRNPWLVKSWQAQWNGFSSCIVQTRPACIAWIIAESQCDTGWLSSIIWNYTCKFPAKNLFWLWYALKKTLQMVWSDDSFHEYRCLLRVLYRESSSQEKFRDKNALKFPGKKCMDLTPL